MNKPVLSICIPTFNRGRCAYDTATRILEYNGDDIEVFVLDNDSFDDTIEHLKKIDDKRFRYSKNDYNIRTRTFARILTHAAADFCMWLSDEDNIDIGLLPEIIDYIKNNPSSGAILNNVLNTVGTLVYNYGKRQVLKAGNDAVTRLGFTNNYISGIVINKNYIDFDYFETKKFYDEATNYTHPYPHHYILLQAIEKGDAFITGKILVSQRVEVNYPEETRKKFAKVAKYYEPSQRLSTFDGKCEYIFNSPCFSLSEKLTVCITSYAADYIIHTLSLFQFILQSKEKQFGLNLQDRIHLYSDYNTIDMIPEVFDNVYAIIQKHSGINVKKQINDFLQELIKNHLYPSFRLQLSAFKISFNYFLNSQRLFSFLISNPFVSKEQIDEIRVLNDSLLKTYNEMSVFFKYVLPCDNFLNSINDFYNKSTAVTDSLNENCEIPVELTTAASKSVLYVIDEWKSLNEKILKTLDAYPAVLNMYQEIK